MLHWLVSLPLRLVFVAAFAVLFVGLIVAVFFALLFAPAKRRNQIARAMSRVLNASTDGDGDTTFSAQSYENARNGGFFAKARLSFVDLLNWREPNHCENAWKWHVERKLIGTPND